MEISVEQCISNDYKNLSELLLHKKIEQKNAIQELVKNIKRDIEKTKDKLFIVSAAYDNVYKKYYGISLSILILSSLTTFIEALRLSVLDYVNKKIIDIDEELLTLILNVIVLCMGTVITILSSIIRFKNYRELLEQLREKQNTIIEYKDKYNKKYDQLLCLSSSQSDTLDTDIKHIIEKVTIYDNEIKSMNILQYLRNKDIIRYNRYKANFECELKKIELEKKLTMESFENTIQLKKNNLLMQNLKHNLIRNADNGIINIQKLT